MEIDIVERLGERLLAHARHLQHFGAVRIADDARFAGAGAQRVGDLGRPPMGMHVDHCSHLYLLQEPPLSLPLRWPAANSYKFGRDRLCRARVPRGCGSAAGHCVYILDPAGQSIFPP